MDLKEQLSSLTTSPRKILKIILSISAILLVMWLFMISRMEYSSPDQPEDQARQERVDSLRISLNQQEQGVPPGNDRSSNFFANAFVTFLVLITILGIVWLWSRKKLETAPAGSFLTEVGGHVLGQGAQLKIIEINEEIWVLGVTGQSVDLLHRCPKEEWNGPITTPETGQDHTFYNLFKSKL